MLYKGKQCNKFSMKNRFESKHPQNVEEKCVEISWFLNRFFPFAKRLSEWKIERIVNL